MTLVHGIQVKSSTVAPNVSAKKKLQVFFPLLIEFFCGDSLELNTGHPALLVLPIQQTKQN
jgi:hypothetical protein